MVRLWIRLWVALVCLGALPVFAGQLPPADDGLPPPHFSLIEGSVVVDREGVSENGAINAPLLDGDRVRTGHGRAQLVFADGTVLSIDADTSVDLLAPDLLRLTQGRLYLEVAGDRDPARAARYQVDTPPASVQTNGPGEYRLDLYAGTSGVELALLVVSGSATMATDAGSTTARAGERVRGVAGDAPSLPEYFNSARLDAFAEWATTWRDQRRGVVSAEYLPDSLSAYSGVFDRYGTWRQDPDYGYVWYPTVVADWRPYSVGYWELYPSWDSFWISGDPWGWPTHHYGRWGFSLSLGWYWIPGRTWGASWVYWAVAPGYVSWCPLGYANRPVFGLWGVRGHLDNRPVDPWRGWTVVPRQHFGRAVLVTHVAVRGSRIDPALRGTFVAQRAAPVRHTAVPQRGGGQVAPSPRSSSMPSASLPPRGAGMSATSRFSRTPGAPPSQPVTRRAVPGTPGYATGGRSMPAPARSGGILAPGRQAPVPSPTAVPRGQSRVLPGSPGPAGFGGSIRSPAPRASTGIAAPRAGERHPAGLPPTGPSGPSVPSWGTPSRGASSGSAVPRGFSSPQAPSAPRAPAPNSGYRAAPPFQRPTPSGRNGAAPGASRSSPSDSYRSAPAAPRSVPPGSYRSAPAAPRSAPPVSSRGGSASSPPSRGTPPRTAAPPARSAPAPSSRYNSGAATPRGSATPRGTSSPRGGQSRRPPGRET